MVALKTGDIDAFVAKPDTARAVVLVFGPDAGLVSERVDAIVKISVDDINDPFALVELATGKTVMNGRTFARVSSDYPGQQQRFARARARLDAEDRAAKVIAENIRTRLASFFVAGT